jgi:hypothetical protein
VTKSGSGRDVVISWNASAGAIGYRIRATLNGVELVNQQVPGSPVGANNVPPGNYVVQVFAIGPGNVENPTPGQTSFAIN